MGAIRCGAVRLSSVSASCSLPRPSLTLVSEFNIGRGPGDGPATLPLLSLLPFLGFLALLGPFPKQTAPAHHVQLAAEGLLFAAENLLLVLFPALDQVADHPQFLQLVPQADDFIVALVGLDSVLAGTLALLLRSQVGLLVAWVRLVVFFELVFILKIVDVAAQHNEHGLKPQHQIVAGAAGAVADPPAVGAQPSCLFLSVFVVFEAVAAVLSPTNILIPIALIVEPAVAPVVVVIQ